jgi:rod shape-determining protein MreC
VASNTGTPRRLGRRLNRRQRWGAALLSLAAIGFIVLDLGGGSLESAHSGVRGSFGALYRGTDSLIGPVREWLQGLPRAGTNTARINELRAENAQLRGALAAGQAARASADQAARLQSMAVVQAAGGHVIVAKVMSIGAASGFDWTVTVDKGAHDGLASGQTVTDGVGLVGRVLHADPASAVVLLAADPGSGVGARDLRNGEIGVASGDGASGFTFRPLNPKAKLKVGDALSTGPGADSSYVPGLAVGTVASVTTSADGTTTAHVKPASAPTALDVLGVVAMPNAAS